MRIQRLHTTIAVMSIGLLIALVSMACLIDSGYEITQMRNAFIATPGIDSDFNWTPDDPPDAFLRDSGVPPVEFQEAVDTMRESFAENTSELDHALLLARHLSGGPGRGPSVKSNTLHTYRTILT